MEHRYYSSPVDYEAWRKGYMPPTEHVLIHKLSVGEAKAIGCSYGGDAGWWLVTKGDKRPTRAQRKAVRFLLETMDEIDAEEEAERAAAAQETQPSPTEPTVNKEAAE